MGERKRYKDWDCIRCRINEHDINVTGSLLCDDCFQETVDRLRATYGRREKKKTRREIARQLQKKARGKGHKLTINSIEFRMKDGWSEEEIINTPQGDRRKEVVSVQWG